MRRFLLVLSYFLLVACKSLSYNDLNPMPNPNSNLLPALEPIVDISNLETVYSSGGISGYSNSYGYGNSHIYGTGNNLYGSSGRMQSSYMNMYVYKDARVEDAVNIFTQEVKDNITNPYGKKKGYIVMKLLNRGVNNCGFCRFVSGFSLFTINLLGVPVDSVAQSLDVEVEIYNNNKELIWRKKAHAYAHEYIAIGYGYSGNTIYRKLAADNLKQALILIKMDINSEADKIKKSLRIDN